VGIWFMQNSQGMLKQKNIKKIFFSITSGLSLTIVFLFLEVFSANIRVEPSSWTLIKWCPYNFEIMMNTDSEETSSIDSKLFMDDFILDQIISSDLDHISILTWVANNGIHMWENYTYLNNYQDVTSSGISWSEVVIAKLLFNVKTGTQTTGGIEFYFLWARVNSDDSNISKWENSDGDDFTKYVDMLDSVKNGSYNFVNASICDNVPLVVSWLYDWSIIAGPRFNYPIEYSWDNHRNIPSHSTGREIWTNTAVTLIVTWDKIMSIDESTLSGISAYAINNNPESISKTIIITGNISSAPISFFLDGTSWTKYSYEIWWATISGDFFIDVFWIDKYISPLTGSVEYDNLSTFVYLTGYTGWVSRSEKDDEYKILLFSGTEVAPTNFLLSPENNFSLYHKMLFTGGRSGDIIYIDRAGNTGAFFIEVEDIIDYNFFAKPNSRLVTAFTPNPNFASKYIIKVYEQDKTFVCSGEVETNNFGSWVFRSFEALSGTYYVSVKWLAHLEHIMSWVVLNTWSSNIVDASSGRRNRPLWLQKDDEIVYDFEYKQIAGPPFSNNLSVYTQYTGSFVVWDAYNLIWSSPLTISYSSGVYRDNLSSNIWSTWKLNYSLKVTDPDIDNFETEPSRLFYSGSVNVSQSGYFNETSTNNIHTFLVPWELVYDGEINGVDSSVVIQYIREHWATYSNSGFWFVPEDLNANGRVDAADITIHGYNLYKVGETIED